MKQTQNETFSKFSRGFPLLNDIDDTDSDSPVACKAQHADKRRAVAETTVSAKNHDSLQAPASSAASNEAVKAA